jgi:hypothetical protein
MLLPIIIILSIIILGTIICAAGHKISNKKIRYPATFGVKKKKYSVIDDCLEELGYGRG